MASVVSRLGAAVLLGTIPFTAAGCKGEKSSTVQAEEVKPTARNISEVFKYKRDYSNHKIFVSSNKDYKIVNDALHSLDIVGEDIRRFYIWQQDFNNRAFDLEQREIRFDLLSAPPKPIDRNLLPVEEKIDVFPFIDPFKEKELKSSSFLLLPRSNFSNSKIPLGITLSERFKFLPYSVERRHYLHRHNDGLLQAKEGICFKVQERTNNPDEENKGVGISIPLSALPFTIDMKFKFTEPEGKILDIVVPVENAPIAIDTGKAMYLIGMDKVTVGEGKFGVVEQ